MLCTTSCLTLKFYDTQPENVQNAMDVTSEQFTERMTLDIANANGEIAYPIATYTYLIIYLTTMDDCDQAIELFR